MSRRFLIFSGHNDRAVVALCRFFDQAGLPFVIVASGAEDAIHRTTWAGHVVFNRLDAVVQVDWLRTLASSLEGPLVYCPTTEFINAYVLAHRQALAGSGLEIGLPDKAIYDALTGKHSSQAFLTSLCPALRLPAAQPIDAPHAPCVLKPRENVAGGRVRYPLLCRDQGALDQALAGLDRQAYFAQDFVIGQSHYLCAHIARDGRIAWFWQTNLLQQTGGKSIVLACAGANPGLDADALLKGLHARGYFGPFMMEVIASEQGLYYIEVNPRFWGPLQLALDVCPEILSLFAHDCGFDVAVPPSHAGDQTWYAWAYGAAKAGRVAHPAAQSLSIDQIDHLLKAHDVYARPDTQALHGCH
jgi:hypothetical protein